MRYDITSLTDGVFASESNLNQNDLNKIKEAILLGIKKASFDKILTNPLKIEYIYELFDTIGQINAFNPKLAQDFFSKYQDQFSSLQVGLNEGEVVVIVNYPYWENQICNNVDKMKNKGKKISEYMANKWSNKLMTDLKDSNLNDLSDLRYDKDFREIYIQWE